MTIWIFAAIYVAGVFMSSLEINRSVDNRLARIVFSALFPIVFYGTILWTVGDVLLSWFKVGAKRRLLCRHMGTCRMWGFEWRGRSYGIFRPTVDYSFDRSTKFSGVYSRKTMFGVMWD